MAQMIPEFYDDATTPPGEKLFFGWLTTECPSNWIVFHGLDLQAWNRSHRTEIDFLVVIPESGILCIEIKSQQTVAVHNGSWFLNGKRQEKAPHKQAEDAQKAFYRRLKDKLPELTHIPSTRLVVFPCALIKCEPSIEYNSWEIWNEDDCLESIRNKTFADKLVRALESTIKHTHFLRKLENPVSVSEARKLENFLRPAFKSAPASIAEAKLRSHRMDAFLREQQKPVLTLFRNDKKLILNGPAGTGKSLIAVEVARRAKDEGLRTGLFCFNSPMARSLKAQAESDGPLLVAGGVHARLSEMLEIEIPTNANADYWDHEFPEIAESRLLDDDRKFDCHFDLIVLDEVQDLLARPRIFDLVDCLLEGGFRHGKWLIAGDFKYQVFANDELRAIALQKLAELRDIPRVAFYELDENCRNYRMVGDPALKLAGMNADQVYSGFMRGDGNHTYFNPKFFANEKQQVGLLSAEIHRHINNGTSAEDITILSFRSAEQCVAQQLDDSDIVTRRIGQPGRGVAYGSIHEFKGLESNVVILTDVRQPKDQFERDLFYVGMTRALYSVSILVPQKHQSWFLEAIQGKAYE